MIVVALISGVFSSASAQEPLRAEFAAQIRTASTFGAPSPHRSLLVAGMSRGNRALLGGIVGAVALPGLLYLLLHDADSGHVSLFDLGQALPVAIVGAFLGVLVALGTGG